MTRAPAVDGGDPWAAPRLRSSPARLAAGLGLGVVALLGTLIAENPQGNGPHQARQLDFWGGLLIVAAVTLTVTLLPTAPLPSLVAALLLVNGYLLLHYPYGPIQLCSVVAMYALARRRRFGPSLLICGGAAVVTSGTIYLQHPGDVALPWVLALAWTGWLIVPWLLGALVQTAAAGRERTRRHLIAQGAMEERVKLAAEVHDVAGHGFALVAMQAGVALLDFETKPDQVRRSLEAIQTTSSKSLTALRGMLDTFHDELRPETTAEPVAAPVPAPVETRDRVGLDGLVDLVDQVRAGGLPVRLDIRNLFRSPDAEADAVSYRVVQESLTNVLRHAGPTTAEVAVEQDAESLLVRVQDRGRGGPVEPHGQAQGQARGLAGMRRRVEAVGGSITAGPRDGGGFRVEARLPMAKGSA
jgi:signal transduction histidine kinase